MATHSIVLRAQLILSFVAFAVCGNTASAQDDETLQRVQATGVFSIDAGRDVYYSDGQQDRARQVADLLETADGFFADLMGVEPTFSLAVLGEADWTQIWPIPYGLPYLSLSEPWVVVMPADPEQSILFPELEGFLGSERAEQMVDNIGFHEVGHVYTSAAVYPQELSGAPPVRWLDEFLASYLAMAFLEEAAPERAAIWRDYVSQASELPAPKYSSLGDFEAEYYGFLGSPEGSPNYGWYQATFAQRAAEIYADRGADFIEDMRVALGGLPTDEWTTESMLELLERLAPGTQDWASKLDSAQ